jgi:homoserine dehydrogenase
MSAGILLVPRRCQAKLQTFSGVLNSTTNLVLTRMEAGESQEQAIAYAQAIGRRTNPSGDIDGWDAAVKVAAWSPSDGPALKPDRWSARNSGYLEDIARQGQGCRWKLVCSARRLRNGVQAGVAPEMVSLARLSTR